MTTALQEQIAAAKLAAAEASTAVAENVADYTKPAAYSNAPAVRMPSLLESADASGLIVDQYFSVTPDGFRVGKDAPLMTELTVEIDFNEVVPSQNIRGEANGRVMYARTTDGITSTRGKPWHAEVSEIQRASDPAKYSEYSSYEIPFTLVEDIVDSKKIVLFKAGTTVGFTPAERNSKELQKFLRKNRDIVDKTALVTLTHDKRVGAQRYGVAMFSLAEAE